MWALVYADSNEIVESADVPKKWADKIKFYGLHHPYAPFKILVRKPLSLLFQEAEVVWKFL